LNEKPALLQVFQKFLVGTEVCEKIDLITCGELETLVQVALTHPTRLQQLREVKNGTFIIRSVAWADSKPEEKTLWEMFHKVKISTKLLFPMIFQYFF
jgi:hypothetical protein